MRIFNILITIVTLLLIFLILKLLYRNKLDNYNIKNILNIFINLKLNKDKNSVDYSKFFAYRFLNNSNILYEQFLKVVFLILNILFLYFKV